MTFAISAVIVQLPNNKYPDMPLNFVVPNKCNSFCIVGCIFCYKIDLLLLLLFC